MTSWRNSARAGDSIRDFIFDFGSGKDSTTVLPSHMLIEPCSFWATAKPSNFSSPVPVNGTERLAEDVRISKASGDPVHFKKEKPNLLDALKPGDRVMFRVEYHRKLDGTEKDVFIPKADDPNKEEKFIGTFTPALAPMQPKPSLDNVRAMCDAHKLSPELEKQLCDSTTAATPQPSTADAGIQQIITNSEAAKSSPARAAALANVGHTQTPEELALLVQSGQASRCAVVTMPPSAEVFVDDNKLGMSPVVFVLLKQGATPRTVTIKMAGYKTVEKNFVPDGKTIPIGLTLEKDSQ
jgi:hypothetical protein